ncbi:MAG: 2-oxoacid:acceptor oxidoreductase subunit alpha [Proteobacteria bacterium]|nr:2-oxoacid:acceptor oxidoreductase subunit alpha [Pseudomonadota bacterium]
MKINEFNWKIGGEAGEGIMVTGLIFSKACAKLGLEVFNYAEYPSRIRGGHNCYQVKAQENKPVTAEKELDILIALNKETITLHLDEMTKNGLIIYDSNIKDISINYDGLYPVPMEELAIKAGGKITKNNVSLGVSAGILNMPLEAINSAVTKAFKDKGEKVLNMNLTAVKEGYDFVLKNPPKNFTCRIDKKDFIKRYVMTGNEAIALGAIKAGLKLYAAYPMTPASSILHFLAPLERKYRILVKHTEDEIAAILTAIGASFAGIRSMAGTSGGGFSLMTEALGMAAITEVPLVIVECMRPGPSTGMPTWTEQGDLRFVMHASQGDFIRVILTPGDIAEAYHLIQLAFNLAEKYQIPVILMSDKFLSESSESIDRLTHLDLPKERGKRLKDVPPDYKRYDLSIEDGISWRAFPPSPKGMQLANSDEHDEYGLVTEESDLRIQMVHKRMKRLESIKKEVPKPVLYGDKNAEISLIGFGSVKNPILRAMEYLNKEGIKVNFLHCLCPHPFVPENYIDFVKNTKRLICVENNYFGQFAGILQENLLIEIKERLLKYDGRPFFPHEIVQYIKEGEKK